MSSTSHKSKDSVLTSLSELRRREAERVAEAEAARQEQEASRLRAEQEVARQERAEARRREEAEAAQRRVDAERAEAARRQELRRQQEADRLRQVEAELALERARILSAPLEVRARRPAVAWVLSALLVVGLATGGGLYLQLRSRSGELTRYNDQLSRLDRESRDTRARLGEQLGLREEQIKRLRTELTTMKQAREVAVSEAAAREAAARAAAASKKASKVAHGARGSKGKGKGKGKTTVLVSPECLNSSDPIGCINQK